MSPLFDDDRQEPARKDADLTLGVGSLLSIFFGIVLICGVFFGFGYSMGRRNSHPAPATASSAREGPAETVSELSGNASRPTGASTAPAPSTPAAHGADEPTSTREANPGPARPEVPAAPAPKPAPSPQAAPETSLDSAPAPTRRDAASHSHMGIKAPLEQAEGDAAPAPGRPVMVQIAAISRRSDAEVLASALERRGFTPAIRPGTSDHLFHVQIGPFSSRSQAEAVKQRLLSDGYNAILK